MFMFIFVGVMCTEKFSMYSLSSLSPCSFSSSQQMASSATTHGSLSDAWRATTSAPT